MIMMMILIMRVTITTHWQKEEEEGCGSRIMLSFRLSRSVGLGQTTHATFPPSFPAITLIIGEL